MHITSGATGIESQGGRAARNGAAWCVLLVWLAMVWGCATPSGREQTTLPPGVSPKLARPLSLLDAGRYTDAMIECIDLARQDPFLPGLAEVEQKIVRTMAEQRAAASSLKSSVAQKVMEGDIEAARTVPGTYGLTRAVRGETGSLRHGLTSMQEALRKKVSLHLDGVNLDAFILAVGASEGINIMSDSLDTSKTMTIHAENVPLQEILDYVSRNLGVSFYVGENVIWATPRQSSEPATPMITRMYRLRKGLSNEELSDAQQINIIQAIEKFVPKEPGSDAWFDKQAHVLIARNTRDNLAKIEEIIDALDVCPPQVLIEARFISAQVSDLRELGIDWILNSPIVVTKENVLIDNRKASVTESQIDPTAPNAIVGFTPFPGNAQGLNLSYQGILTDPMFKAVLHALETSGKARTLSVPKVATVNNRPAMIRIGEDFRYFEEYDVQSVPTSVTDSGSQVYSSILVPVGTPVKEELGITLNVTPSVGADLSSIRLYIVPEISEFMRYEYYEVGKAGGDQTSTTVTNGTSIVKLPIFRRSKIETELIVRSGETVVMGGLISSAESRKQEKVPVLSEIPIVGRLFRRDAIEETKQNLLIFVTATLLSELGENLIPMSASAEQSGGN